MTIVWGNGKIRCFKQQLVNWCFEPSEPLGIISGRTKRYIFERTNKTEKKAGRTEWENGELSGEYNGIKYSRKGLKDRKRHTNRTKRSGQARLVRVFDRNRNIPTTWRWAHEDFSNNRASSEWQPCVSDSRAHSSRMRYRSPACYRRAHVLEPTA